MLFFYGTYLIGKMEMCDGVYIATRFVHIWWLPLIPIKTVLVLEPNRAVPIAFRWKSALFGWLRVWGLIATPAVVFGFGVSLLAILDRSTTPPRCWATSRPPS